MKKTFTLLAALALACGITAQAGGPMLTASLSTTEVKPGDSTAAPDPSGILYLGTYKEVVTDGSDAQLKLWAWEDDLNITLESFFEERMTVIGKIDPSKAESVGSSGVRIPITLRLMNAGQEVAHDDVILTFTETAGNLYKLHVDFVNEPSESAIRNLRVDYTMYLTDPNVEHIVATLPFTIDKTDIRLTKILPELNKYVSSPELWTMVDYIKRGQDDDNLCDTEQITINERNRFFSYAFGELNVNMEGKYFRTSDGKIMLIIDRHDATYDHEQDLRIFIIDPAAGTFTEEEAYNLFPKQYIDANAIFQVRRDTEGVVAVYDTDDGGLDAKTLKFNGKTFK